MSKKQLFKFDADLVGGKMQPQSVDLEEVILGAMLLEGEAVNNVIDILQPEMFYKEQHGMVYKAILELYKKNQPIDILTVTKELYEFDELENVGGAYFISSLTNRIASSANIEFHARIVVQNYLKREMIRLSSESIKDAYEPDSDVFDLYEKGVGKLEAAMTGVLKYDVQSIGKIHEDVMAESIIVTQSGARSGVPTGYRSLDRFLNGWQKTDLIIVAGRTSMGKSVAGLAFALNPAINDNIPTAFFSLEMSKKQVVGRAQSTLSGINSSKIIKNQLTEEENKIIYEKCQPLTNAPIYIDDTPALSLMELKGKARKLVRDKKVKLIVIDYLQLMTADAGKNSNREQEVSMISKGLKSLAKELDIPIIALSQLNRVVENRADKRPQLSDLRESGSIEMDSDLVLFCYRPEYYGINDYELDGETHQTEGLMSLIVGKHRAGSLGELLMGFNGNLTKLENYDEFLDNQRRPTPPPVMNTTENKIQENTGFLDQKNDDPF